MLPKINVAKSFLKYICTRFLNILHLFSTENFLTFLLPSRHHPSSWQTRITKTHSYWENVAIHRPINHHLLLPMENVSIVTSICDCFHLSYFVNTIAYFFPFLPVKQHYFLNFLANLYIPIIFSNLNYNCSNVLDLRNLQKQVKKEFCFKNCAHLSLLK